MKNIKFDSLSTEEKIKQLNLLTNDIENILKDINLKYLELDENYWKSNKKDKLDHILIDYLKKISINYPSDFRSLNNILSQYVANYKDTFEYIKNLMG